MFAIDGVAPKAKMNQQRKRRFRSAIESIEKKIKEKKILTDWTKLGLDLPKLNESSFDSNVITPGTDFMDRLSIVIKHYIKERLQSDERWKDLNIVFSDSNVPGEGEHKILDYIKGQTSK